MAEREIQETEIQVGGSPQGQAQPTTSKAVEGQTCINGAIQEKKPNFYPISQNEFNTDRFYWILTCFLLNINLIIILIDTLVLSHQ